MSVATWPIDGAGRYVTLCEATEQIATEEGLTVAEVRGPRRMRGFVMARARVAHAARNLGYSLPEIGRYLGGRDHTTILALLRGGKSTRKPGAPSTDRQRRFRKIYGSLPEAFCHCGRWAIPGRDACGFHSKTRKARAAA